jgi:hypothetical protein
VFLTDPEMQAGLNAAVEELKAVRQSLNVISDELDIVEYGSNPAVPLAVSDAHRAPVSSPSPPVDEMERQQRLSLLIEDGLVEATVASLDNSAIDRAIVAG